MGNLSSNKQIRLLYFILNTVVIIPFIMSFFSVFGSIATLAILAGGFVYFVIGGKESTEPYTEIIKILFMDTLICGSLIFLYFLGAVTEAEYLPGEQLANLSINAYLFVFIYVIGIVLKRSKPLIAYIISWFSLIVIGYLLCIALCTVDGSLIMPEFIKGGAVVLHIYLIFAAVFSLCSILVILAGTKNFNIFMFSISFIIFFFVLISSYSGILNKFYEWEKDFGNFTSNALLWAKVTVVYVIALLTCLTILFRGIIGNKGKMFCFNINVLLFIANAALLYKFTLSWYSGFNYVLVYLYVFAVLFMLWRDLELKGGEERKNLSFFEKFIHEEIVEGLKTTEFIIAAAVLSLASIWMFKHNMLVNALIILLFMILAFIPKKPSVNAWIYATVFIFLQALAWIFQFKLSLDNVFFATVMVLITMATLFVLNLRNPNGFKTAAGLNIAVFVLFCILNLVLISRHGSKISVYPDDKKVGVVVKAIGGDNQIEEAVIYWTDGRGEKITEETEFTDQIESDVHGACIHIVTTDSFGVVSSKTQWFPYWSYIVYE